MPQHDPYSDNAHGLESPASNALTITPSDDLDLPVKPRGIMVNVAGDLCLVMGESTVTIRAQEGAIYPLRPTRILASGTTAADITIIW